MWSAHQRPFTSSWPSVSNLHSSGRWYVGQRTRWRSATAPTRSPHSLSRWMRLPMRWRRCVITTRSVGRIGPRFAMRCADSMRRRTTRRRRQRRPRARLWAERARHPLQSLARLARLPLTRERDGDGGGGPDRRRRSGALSAQEPPPPPLLPTETGVFGAEGDDASEDPMRRRPGEDGEDFMAWLELAAPSPPSSDEEEGELSPDASHGASPPPATPPPPPDQPASSALSAPPLREEEQLAEIGWRLETLAPAATAARTHASLDGESATDGLGDGGASAEAGRTSVSRQRRPARRHLQAYAHTVDPAKVETGRRASSLPPLPGPAKVAAALAAALAAAPLFRLSVSGGRSWAHPTGGRSSRWCSLRWSTACLSPT